MKNFFTFYNSKKGFTMIELLLYMGIFSILLIVLMQLFTLILSVHTESQATSSVDQDGNFALARLAYDIHRSSSVTLPTLGTSGNTLQLVINGATDMYSIKLISGNNYLVFTDSVPTDTLLNGPGTSASVSFKTLGNDPSSVPPPACAPICKQSVAIVLTLTPTVAEEGSTQSKTFQTTVGIR